ncbi:hypothetical protein ADK65_33785 [Streptomyces sp. NRRL B-1140]|uniref:hypothetical protein n=1 Tax=Streptomyces sp. NRRL B-1140 TaxID=1415549 RepID=UPI0006AEDA2B|nr:hypothetical protein [Streptomyces sp. NRRL B-1140]KOV92585.1 hypothetical protein ADK65_33785 [Streptomyces sp. NRRL B-1140]
MPIEAITGALAAGIIQAMTSDAWANVRPRITRMLGTSKPERDALAGAFDEHAATVRRGDRSQARNDLVALLRDYAATHPDAADTFQAVIDELEQIADVTVDNSTTTGDVSNSIVAGNRAQVATGGGTIQGSHSVNASGRARVRQDYSTRHQNITEEHNGGGGKVLLLALAGLAAVVFVIFLVNRAQDDKASDDGAPGPVTTATATTKKDPLDGVPVRTCGEWLRLPAGEGEPIARDIALRLGNTQAASDAWIVQNTQYGCGGVEDRLLADVLAPSGT